MQYAVPQYIEVEDKVIGPLTIRQFLIILGGALISAIWYGIFDQSLFIFATVLTIGAAAGFAFIKINGQRLEKYVGYVGRYYLSPQTRIWAKEISKKSEKLSNAQKRIVTVKGAKEEISRSKLHDLSNLLDTSARYYTTIEEQPAGAGGESAGGPEGSGAGAPSPK
jgi:hypothetical protein